jgi:hypothetical protein
MPRMFAVVHVEGLDVCADTFEDIAFEDDLILLEIDQFAGDDAAVMRSSPCVLLHTYLHLISAVFMIPS